MKILTILRLLLQVYGGLFLGVMAISVAVYGVLPYEALMRLGSLMFYALIGAAFALWLMLAARTLARRRDGTRDRDV